MAIHPPERVLVLWDIDHTLIETRGVGNRLYRQAFEAVTGRRVEHHIEITGRTEQTIFAEALRLHGVKPTDQLVAAYQVELTRQYEEHAGLLRERGRELPGAVEALTALAGIRSVVQTVLTGNLRAVAAIKLRVFGLDGHIDFEIGAYGEDDPERSKLVSVAQRRARARYGMSFALENTVVVGDTTSDVLAAHTGGAKIVAVASGRASEAALHEAGAQVVLPDLTDTTGVVRAVVDLE